MGERKGGKRGKESENGRKEKDGRGDFHAVLFWFV
jgi:hypothetical protein